MSIVRMGMSEDSKFAEGYDAIFGKKTAKKSAAKKPAPAAKKPAPAAKKPTPATKKK
ncbi:hypothetical protein R5W24_004688 [Gemmata sp. JC717]|uniref:hypothetical protein n=1 Tax=Gemmata algarum TaxID=2975278 RepID=UPI0021BA4C94|nr:hypothetical protein [Gemmata algarum]MDY3555545.1 hypothetical protein [Gemmata algarum]